MTLRISSAGAGAPPTGVPVLSLVEATSGYRYNPETWPFECEQYSFGVKLGNNPDATRIHPSGAGAVPTTAWDSAIGRTIAVQVPQVGSVNAAWGNNVQYAVRMPMYQRFSVAGAVPISAQRPLRRYYYRLPIRKPVVGVASCFVGVGRNTGVSLATLPQFNMYAWASDPALNGGRWTAQFRQADGGAIVTVGDSGVLPNAVNWENLGVRYTEGAVPTFEWMLNDLPIFQVSGDANMPVTAVGDRVGMYPAWGCCQAAVGTILHGQAAQFSVEEV